MSTLRQLRLSPVLFSAALLLFASSVCAQTARVFTVNSLSNELLDVSFDPAGTTVVNTDAADRKGVRSITIRYDGVAGIQIFAGDARAGELLVYAGGSGEAEVVADAYKMSAPERPVGLSLDSPGNLYVLGDPDLYNKKAGQVWTLVRDASCPDANRDDCLPGGYRAPLGLLDAEVTVLGRESGQLEDSVVVRRNAGVLVTGDLLVVSRAPSAVLRYPAADIALFLAGSLPEVEPEVLIFPAEEGPDPAREFPRKTYPTGIAIGPGDALLIPTTSGDILRYGPDAQRAADFANAIGEGEFKIKVGPQNGQFKAFVSDREGDRILRFRISTDGTGMLDGVVSEGVDSPIGLDTTTGSDPVPTEAGSSIPVAATGLLESVIEAVSTAGQSSGRTFIFADPRDAGGQFEERDLLLSEVSADLPAVTVPPYIRAFPNTDGVPTFILVSQDTSASNIGIVEHLGFEETVLGFEPNCDDEDPSLRPRLAWTPDANDPAIVEGERFIDVTFGCGSSRGLTRDFSLFLIGVRNMLPLDQLVSDKLTNLDGTLAAATCIDAKLARRLAKLLSAAVDSIARGKTSTAEKKLVQFVSKVMENPDGFSACTTNVSGELRARADSAIFTLSELDSKRY